MFRSEDVSLYGVTADSENVWELLNLLGSTSQIMIERNETSISVDKLAANRVRRIDDWKQKFEGFLFRSQKFGAYKVREDIEPAIIESLIREKSREKDLRQQQFLEELLQVADKKIKYFEECHNNFDIIASSIVELVMTRSVLANVYNLLPQTS